MSVVKLVRKRLFKPDSNTNLTGLGRSEKIQGRGVVGGDHGMINELPLIWNIRLCWYSYEYDLLARPILK